MHHYKTSTNALNMCQSERHTVPTFLLYLLLTYLHTVRHRPTRPSTIRPQPKDEFKIELRHAHKKNLDKSEKNHIEGQN